MTHRILKSTLSAHGARDIAVLVQAHVADVAAWHEHERLLAEERLTPAPAEPRREDYQNVAEFAAAIGEFNAAVLSRRAPYPRPIAHPDVDASVNVDVGADGRIKCWPDFEIVDDGPSDEQKLASKKQALTQAISDAEATEVAKVIPPGKQRVFALRMNDIRIADGARLQKIHEEMARKNSEIISLQKRKMEIDSQGLFKKLFGVIAAEQEALESEISTIVVSSNDLHKKVSDVEAFHKMERPPEDHDFVHKHTERLQMIEAIYRWGAQLHAEVEDLTVDNIDAWQMAPFGDWSKCKSSDRELL